MRFIQGVVTVNQLAAVQCSVCRNNAPAVLALVGIGLGLVSGLGFGFTLGLGFGTTNSRGIGIK